MSNSLTNIDQTFMSRQSQMLTNVNDNLNKIKKDDSTSKTFSKMLDDKISTDGRIKLNNLNKKEKKLYDSCVDMESLLWKQVLNSMKKTINKYKLIDGGYAEDVFTDFLYDEYSMMMAKNSSTNLSGEIFKQLYKYI